MLLVFFGLMGATGAAVLIPGGLAVADGSPSTVFQVTVLSTATLTQNSNGVSVTVRMKCDPEQSVAIDGTATQKIGSRTVTGTRAGGSVKMLYCTADGNDFSFPLMPDVQSGFEQSGPDAWVSASMSAGSQAAHGARWVRVQ